MRMRLEPLLPLASLGHSPALSLAVPFMSSVVLAPLSLKAVGKARLFVALAFQN